MTGDPCAVRVPMRSSSSLFSLPFALKKTKRTLFVCFFHILIEASLWSLSYDRTFAQCAFRCASDPTCFAMRTTNGACQVGRPENCSTILPQGKRIWYHDERVTRKKSKHWMYERENNAHQTHSGFKKQISSITAGFFLHSHSHSKWYRLVQWSDRANFFAFLFFMILE